MCMGGSMKRINGARVCDGLLALTFGTGAVIGAVTGWEWYFALWAAAAVLFAVAAVLEK